MKIVKVETIPVSVPLKKPLREAPAEYNLINHVIIKVRTDEGIVGLGEACALPPFDEETAETVVEIVNHYLTPRIIGEDPFNIEKIIEMMDAAIPLNLYAKSGIDMALHDIMGKKLKVPIHRLLGGQYRERIPGGWEVGISTPKKAAEEATEAVQKGFAQLKIKVGLSPERDLERIKAVRDAVGHDVTVGADANQAWNPRLAIKMIEKMEKYDVAWIEQPVQRWNVEGLCEVKKAVETPLMADESVRTPQDAMNLILRDAVSMFNIKIAKHGGLHNAKKIAAIAEASDVSCMEGMLYEYGIAAAAGFHFAASTKPLPLGNEIIEGPLMAQDDLIVEPLRITKGSFEAPKGFGLGIELDEAAVAKYAEHFKAQRKQL